MRIEWITRDFFLKIACVVLSGMLWLYVKKQAPPPETSRQFTFAVEIKPNTLSDDLAILSIQREISGKAFGTPEQLALIAKIPPESMIAISDLSNASSPEPGKQPEPTAFGVRLPNIAAISAVKWELDSDKIEATIDNKGRTRRPVTIDFAGLPDGHGLGGSDIDPERVELEGPETLLQRVETVFGLLDLKAKNEPGTDYRVKLQVLDKGGKPLSNINLRPSSVSVHPVLTAASGKRVLVSPVWIGQPDPQYKVTRIRVEPNTVVVEGNFDKLKNMVSVETRPISLVGLTQQLNQTIKLVAPPGVQVKPSVVRVRVDTEKVPIPVTEAAPTTTVPPTTTDGQNP